MGAECGLLEVHSHKLVSVHLVNNNINKSILKQKTLSKIRETRCLKSAKSEQHIEFVFSVPGELVVA